MNIPRPLNDNEVSVLIGTYTDPLGHTVGGGPGVVMTKVDPEGRITTVGWPADLRNPSYISVNKQGSLAYASSEITDFNGGQDGCVTVLGIDAEQEKLETLQQVSSQGVGPAWVEPTPDGRYLLIANYAAGNTVVLAIDDNDRLGKPTAVLPHTGHGPNRDRQEAPHPHAVPVSPDGQWLYVADLGIDELVGYRFSPDGRAERDAQAGATLPAGCGPRHAAWSADGKWLYVSLELSSQIAVLSYQADNGQLHLEQLIASVVDDADRLTPNFPSEIAVSPDGRFLIIANRGRDTLAVFAIDPDTGQLTGLSDTPTGQTPRHFAFCGPSLVVLAEQDQHRVTSFRFDPANGSLTPTGHGLDLPSPCFVCPLSSRRW